MTRFSLSIAVAATALTFASTAFAGEQYVDTSGYAVSGYDVVAYFDLPRHSVGQTAAAPVAGNAGITAEHNGAKFAFSSEANRDAFLANPAKYAPQYDGHCAYGVSRGGKVPANPYLWSIVDEKLYLNITPNVVMFWEEDIPGHITLASGNWVNIEGDVASDRPVPKLTSTAPKG